jgi:hypothetical protein
MVPTADTTATNAGKVSPAAGADAVGRIINISCPAWCGAASWSIAKAQHGRRNARAHVPQFAEP